LHAVRTPRPSNEREEEKVNGKESEETREESPEKSDDDEVGPARNEFAQKAPRSRRLFYALAM
jgi:hypothetical protein